MEGKLDFSLPEKKHKTSVTPIISVILLLVLIGLAVVNFLRPSYQSPLSENSASFLSEKEVKALAAKLASRNLYTRAAST